MQHAVIAPVRNFDHLDKAIEELDANKHIWAQTANAERVAILREIKDLVAAVAEGWAETAARKKGIPTGSPLAGEEWLSGPYAMLSICDQLIHTLSNVKNKAHIAGMPLREMSNGQIAARAFPHSIWDRLIFSGVTADVWMEPGITKSNLADNTASHYDTPIKDRAGKVALVLGAGNIAAIPPFDCFQKLFSEHQVVILKLNPVNDYLADFLRPALRPLIERGVLRIVKGGADVGAYLCTHPGVEEIHITGAQASHDAIVWGVGETAKRNKANNTPQNTRRITSELGAVCPTIVVPGPWTDADISFQAEHIVTQKLHNSGFNCIACQVLILPETWDKTSALLSRIEQTLRDAPPRPLYYPGAADRLDAFCQHGGPANVGERENASDCVVVPMNDRDTEYYKTTEVFAPALSTLRIAGDDAETYLRAAIEYANDNLHGTLGANILIHPKTIRQIGKQRFEELITELRYGCIAINAWSGVGFLLVHLPWQAFPGHTLDDVQSGIGAVHNTFMFDKPQRAVIRAPFRPFPRTLLSLGLTMLPRPPWFVTNRKAHKIGKLMTAFQHKPSVLKLPRIFLNALLG